MKLKKVLFSPVTTLLAFALAAALLLFSSIGGARAALTFFSETYQSQINLYDIGVTLIENDVNVARRNYIRDLANGSWDEHTIANGNAALLTNLLAEGEKLQLGHSYTERLKVGNSGTINQYVRVTIYRYWADENGNKLPELDSDYIDLHFVNPGDWLIDTAASTEERTVLYYNKLLNSGDATSEFSDLLTVSKDVKKVTTSVDLEDGTTAIHYDYDGKQFVLEARVDAVQQNNAQAAILSAWGRNVVFNADGTLSLASMPQAVSDAAIGSTGGSTGGSGNQTDIVTGDGGVGGDFAPEGN